MLSEEGKKVKKQLEELRHLKKLLKSLQAELIWWRDLSGSVSGGFGEIVDGGIKVPPQEKRIIKIDELERAIDKLITQTMELEDKFLKDCYMLDTLSQNLLFERYLTGKSINRIARDFAYSERQLFRLYDDVYEQIAEKNDKIKRCQ